MSVQNIEKMAQHAALWEASAKGEGGGTMRADFKSLWAIRKKGFKPGASGGIKVQF